ncbi:chemotaxis protein CheW [Halobacillus locisalis]|uniref:Chemotaxis protein CheW n=1 Tax=Halobacillus locisalis TaxID=220753 RepID=A0A838CQ22_9BACI|nr:chemotaxis protein CheW [Halobacillus locisalis]MBA2174090.1 chemotaxis protein CheW [Halobacillus locisalis]
MTQDSKTLVKVIVFQLQDEEYTIPVDAVGSIERMMPITRVPRTAAFVKGVINLRGVVTPIIDLRERFGLEHMEETEQTRIITVTIDGMAVGLIVDAANDVLDIYEDQIEPPPEVVGTLEAEYIQGVVRMDHRLFILLNMSKVLSSDDIKQLQEIDV